MQGDAKLTYNFLLSFNNFFFRFKAAIIDSNFRIEHKTYLCSMAFDLKIN